MKQMLFCRALLMLLTVAAILTPLGMAVWQGEKWYPPLSAMRNYPAPTFGTAEIKGMVYSLDDLAERDDVTFSTCLMLVNASHPLPESYTPELVEYNQAKMHPLMVESYVALRDDIQRRTGVRIYVASDYRTPEEQAEILREEGSEIAAAVGCSEHEAGLALDVYAPYCGGSLFLRSPAGRMVNNVCGEYGYIIRYPYQKENVTGIAYEPWHIRYVGQPHAKLIMDHGMTLEEYLDVLTPGVWYMQEEYVFARLPMGDGIELPSTWEHCEISPDNTGYFLVTLRLN